MKEEQVDGYIVVVITMGIVMLVIKSHFVRLV